MKLDEETLHKLAEERILFIEVEIRESRQALGYYSSKEEANKYSTKIAMLQMEYVQLLKLINPLLRGT